MRLSHHNIFVPDSVARLRLGFGLEVDMKKGCVDLHQAVFSTLCGHNLKKVYLKVRNHGEGPY